MELLLKKYESVCEWFVKLRRNGVTQIEGFSGDDVSLVIIDFMFKMNLLCNLIVFHFLLCLLCV